MAKSMLMLTLLLVGARDAGAASPVVRSKSAFVVAPGGETDQISAGMVSRTDGNGAMRAAEKVGDVVLANEDVQPMVSLQAQSDYTHELWPQRFNDKQRCDAKGAGCDATDITQEQCQSNAAKQRSIFYSFDAIRGCCNIAATCDSPSSETVHPWQIFKKPLWSQKGSDHQRCDGKSAGCHNKGFSRRACERRAIEKGTYFYSFDASRKCCNIAETCDSPSSETEDPWQMFEDVWPQEGSDFTRCDGIGDGCDKKGLGQTECQDKAIKKGHDFYTYRADKGCCNTADTCESPSSDTANPWKMFKKP